MAAALLLATTSIAHATQDASPDDGCTPRVVDGWLRAPPMPMPMMAGFARIENPCGVDLAITGASSDAFASVELHETQLVDGVSRMREVPSLQLPAGGEVELRPGGLHLMLMRPPTPLAEGDSATVEFTTADGRRFGGSFGVRAANAR